jgi:hypothetical protein
MSGLSTWMEEVRLPYLAKASKTLLGIQHGFSKQVLTDYILNW